MKHIINQIPKEKINNFVNLTETIGAITIWSGNRIGKYQTINEVKSLVHISTVL